MTVRSVTEHRLDREAGAIIYPVYSRRSGGISLGINLFPDAKVCSFDCPYCEVFPVTESIPFSLKAMEEEIRTTIEKGDFASEIQDFCFSGNGEPTLSPFFPEALTLAHQLRQELAPQAKLVCITNGTGLLDTDTFDLLCRAVHSAERLDIWLKIDAATNSWYEKINHATIALSELQTAFRSFATQAFFTVQTMLCTIQGAFPSQEEVQAWEAFILELVQCGRREKATTGGPRRIHLYGKARPSPMDPVAQSAPEAYLVTRTASLRKQLEAAGYTDIPVQVFV
jgi:histidinol dehydrogenase